VRDVRSLLSVSAVFLLTTALAATVPAASADSSSPERAARSRATDRGAQPRAAGAVVVGSTGSHGLNFVPNVANASLAPVALDPTTPSYTVPGPGVLTSFSHDEGTTGGQIRALLVAPGTAPNTRDVLGYTPKLTSVASTLNTYPVRITVAAGTTLAIWVQNTNMSGIKLSAPGDIIGGQPVDPTTVPTFSVGTQLPGYLVNLSAVWEPDADHDLYGDVSQDLCPQSALTQAACPVPDTTVTKAPKKKSKRRKAKITFTSTVAGSTFTCAVDKKAAVPCTSPFKKKFKYGKHTVVITATSSVGFTDPTPVTVKFKVTKPRH
jgi:hypothetical protein